MLYVANWRINKLKIQKFWYEWLIMFEYQIIFDMNSNFDFIRNINITFHLYLLSLSTKCVVNFTKQKKYIFCQLIYIIKFDFFRETFSTLYTHCILSLKKRNTSFHCFQNHLILKWNIFVYPWIIFWKN